MYGWNHKVSKVPMTLLQLSTGLKLVSDNCMGKNKNSAMIAMCVKCLANDAPKHIHIINLAFPMTRHSFLSPDKFLGSLKKKLRKLALIDVNNYYYIFENFRTVKKLGIQWKTLGCQHWLCTLKLSCKRTIITTGRNVTTCSQ
nr:unnamed protein product [Callosobruchus analis]